MSQYLYLLVKVRTSIPILFNRMERIQSQYLYLLVKVRTVTNTFVTVKKVDDGESQYLYLLVKVRTYLASQNNNKFASIQVAIPIPSGEGQNPPRYLTSSPTSGGITSRNTYTFW